MWKITTRQNEMLPFLVYDEDSDGFRPIADCYSGETAEQIATEHNALAAVTQQRDALREELIVVEWVLSSVRGWYCPRCLSKKTAGHTPDCKRQAALALVRE